MQNSTKCIINLTDNKSARDLAVEMFAHVQGHKDESQEWGQHKLIFDKLRLTPNCADHCIYQDIVDGALVIMARATYDVLC